MAWRACKFRGPIAVLACVRGWVVQDHRDNAATVWPAHAQLYLVTNMLVVFSSPALLSLVSARHCHLESTEGSGVTPDSGSAGVRWEVSHSRRRHRFAEQLRACKT